MAEESREENKEELKEIINKAEISLVLDTYDDIFSDFDPRPYSERALSEDFLAEAKKAARDKRTGIELRFLIPKAVKNATHEELIRTRLKNHFRKHHRLIREELSVRGRNAVALVVVGVVIGVADVLLLSVNDLNAILKDAIQIILTPASWYTIWTGFDRLMIKPKGDVADELFYRKMMDAQITFTPY